MSIIKIEKLSFKYSKKSSPVINDISLDIKEGSITTILGLNGCGKTTLIKLLCGLYRPTSGNILLNDKDVLKYSDYERSKVISYVSQLNSSIGDYGVMEYLLCGMTNSFKFYESPKKENEEMVRSLLNKYGLTKFIDKKLSELSGGERQLISIRCAVLQNTKVIVLDEPTSALDLPNQKMVIQLLKQIVEDKQKTVILSTHNPNQATDLESDVILMKNGEILDKGSYEEIITIDALKPVYGNDIHYASEHDKKVIVI